MYEASPTKVLPRHCCCRLIIQRLGSRTWRQINNVMVQVFSRSYCCAVMISYCHSTAVCLSVCLSLAMFTAIARETGEHGEQFAPRGAVAPTTKLLGGATSTSCSPNFFCNLHLKVTLQWNLKSKVTFNTKILENSPSSGASPRPHCTLRVPFFAKYILHKVMLWIWLFHCFSQQKRRSIYTPPTEKSFPCLSALRHSGSV